MKSLLGTSRPPGEQLAPLEETKSLLEKSRPPIPDGMDLMEYKRTCKARTQQALGFAVDPDAVVFSFIGRWTNEKGIGYLAE